jgi:hypothetical protein
MMSKVISLASARAGKDEVYPEAFRNPEARFGDKRIAAHHLFEIAKLMKKYGLDKQFYGFFRAMANDAYDMMLQGANAIGYSEDIHQWYLEKAGLKKVYQAFAKAFAKYNKESEQ